MNNRKNILDVLLVEKVAGLTVFLSSQEPSSRGAVCKGDGPLRRRLEALLSAHEDESGILNTDADLSGVASAIPIEEGPGGVIGRYKLLQRIGEGGMGVVYMAEQREPILRRVALKIIKVGMDTRGVIARFEAERQALALMDHPHIAKVLDAGATESGRPYFVMELVYGAPITEFCDKNKLPAKDRLQLFIQVCHAIQHAHQKGILHRDIKPSNVLVTLHDGVPVPKVIDFGVAKATNQRLTEKTLFTHYGQMIGTPAYMSPEQAEMSGLDVDTRADVYSLGVLLYELLTGTTPFPSRDLMSLGHQEMFRVIKETDPPKPSTRVSTMQNEERTIVARNRSMEPSGLGRLFRGELDWIVMKALEKDRTRRDATANGLMADVQRHLNNEPVSAVAPTFFYQLLKFYRRRKAVFVATAIALTALLVGGAVATWQAYRATKAAASARLSEAELAFDKGQLLGEQGDANRALLWLSHSLELLPPDTHDLRAAIRRGISAWVRRTVPLEQMFPDTGHAAAVAMSPDNRTFFTASPVGHDGFRLMT